MKSAFAIILGLTLGACLNRCDLAKSEARVAQLEADCICSGDLVGIK